MIVVNLTSGQQEKQFLGYVTNHQRSNGMVYFKMIASSEYVDELKPDAKVYIDADCSVKSLIETVDGIYMALKSSALLEGIVNPKLFGSFYKTPSYYVVRFFVQAIKSIQFHFDFIQTVISI